MARSRRAVTKGVGSLADIGGSTFKRTPVRASKRGDFSTDQKAISRDFRVAIAKASRTSFKAK